MLKPVYRRLRLVPISGETLDDITLGPNDIGVCTDCEPPQIWMGTVTGAKIKIFPQRLTIETQNGATVLEGITTLKLPNGSLVAEDATTAVYSLDGGDAA